MYSPEMRKYLKEINRYLLWRYGNGEEKESQPETETCGGGVTANKADAYLALSKKYRENRNGLRGYPGGRDGAEVP